MQYIVREMRVPVTTIAGAIGRKAPAFAKPERQQPPAKPSQALSGVVTLVDLYAGDRLHARIFLNAPNRHLDNRAPMEFIEHGDLAPLEMYVSAMSARQPT